MNYQQRWQWWELKWCGYLWYWTAIETTESERLGWEVGRWSSSHLDTQGAAQELRWGWRLPLMLVIHTILSVTYTILSYIQLNKHILTGNLDLRREIELWTLPAPTNEQTLSVGHRIYTDPDFFNTCQLNNNIQGGRK